MTRKIKKYCKCSSVAKITKTTRITDDFSQHYIKCSNQFCQRVWVENTEFSHEIKKSKLDNDYFFSDFVKNLPRDIILSLVSSCNVELGRRNI